MLCSKSASLECSDDYFEALIRNTWGMKKDGKLSVMTDFEEVPTYHLHASHGQQNTSSKGRHHSHNLTSVTLSGDMHEKHSRHVTGLARRRPTTAWNQSSIVLGTTDKPKHLVDFSDKSNNLRTPVSKRQSGNNTFRSQFIFG